ncbi:hypothetical protein NOVO_08555 [Rickettsiales bacterium Ac37b]|nr:hypothetical protein NOVO_08555 [Rickettsiales bacterium Ac37b]
MITRIIFILILLAYSITSNADEIKEEDVKVLSASSIFKPLIADPKWPRFTIAYQRYIRGPFAKNVFSPNFGAALPLAIYEAENGIKYEISVHGGIFSTMDIGSSPTRLINADYMGGLALTIKNNKFDYIVRGYHTSSHVGDELLLSRDGQKIKRINLSYETVEAIFAYNFSDGLRPFIGGGYIVHAEPKNFKSAELIVGADYRHTEYYIMGYARPIAGIYSKTSKNYGWHPNISLKAGMEFKDKFAMGKQLQFLLEYYNGRSIHGQFYKKKEHYIGTSINMNF